MKRDEREIERKLEEAIGLAAGLLAGGSPDRGVEAALGGRRSEGSLAAGLATIPAAFSSLLQGMSGSTGAGAPETAPSRSTAGSWSDMIPKAVSGLLTPGIGSAGLSRVGLLSNLNPFLGGILRLFGGGSEKAPRELTAAQRPGPARYELGIGGGESNYFFIDRDASGAPRAAGPTVAPTVVVQVEAMDSRSFMERTPEIAEALKRALLESEGMQNFLANWRE
jgi:hypothetical protein